MVGGSGVGSLYNRGAPRGSKPAKGAASQASRGRLPRPQPAGPSPQPVRQRPGRPARALQCSPGGSDSHRRSQPRGPSPPHRPRLASPQGSTLEGRGPPRQGRAASSVWEGGGRVEGRACAAAGRGQALGSRAARPSVPPAAQLGEGPGCPRGGKVSRRQKWPGIAGWGEGRAGRPLLLAQAERKKIGGKQGGGGGGSRQHRPEQIPPLPTPLTSPVTLPPAGKPERGGTDGLLPHGQGETPSPPRLFLPTSISTRAHLRRLCAPPPPREKKRAE